ncbi:hypothetical protein N8D55_03790 [Xanthomonas hortorum pv. pelargonii]|nr:hypothetical protein N8D55_03790 [Xanthomonas hortorum pv. pelargonii]
MKIEFPAKAAILLSGMLALTAAQAKDPVHSCPVKSTIKQMQKSDGRIEYQAKDSGATWHGRACAEICPTLQASDFWKPT